MRHALLLILLLLPAVGWPNKDASIVIGDPWIREAPPGVTALAGYMDLSNQGAETLVLETISSQDFERVELHQTRIEGNTARMEQKQSLSLSPGSTVKLEPGGYHLMLFKPDRPLKAGDRVVLTLKFKDQSPRTIEAEVRAIKTESTSHQHHH